MSKLYDLSKVMEELAKKALRPKARRVAMRQDEIQCEECGEFVEHLKLTKEGFFHCQPCDFMYIRRKAVQEFDND